MASSSLASIRNGSKHDWAVTWLAGQACPRRGKPERRRRTVTARTEHRRPSVVAFDVVGTLFSLEPLGVRLMDAGFPETALGEWFSRFLHASVSLDVADVFMPFREVAIATLEVMAAERRGLASSRSMAEKIVQGISDLPAHPDVRPAFQALRDVGVRVMALTNGSAKTTQHLLEQAALESFVERIVSIEDVRHWKPRAKV